MPLADDFENAYANLRAQILARHFFLSCYARADHFDMEAHLGDRDPLNPDNNEASPGGVSWHRPMITGRPHRLPDGTIRELPARELYANAQDLQDKLSSGALTEIERWRWTKHDRTNSLLMTGIRLCNLAVEAKLGNTDSLTVIERVLNTLKVLFKFDDGVSFYSGYIVRWDAVASDLWQTEEINGQQSLKQNFEFLLNADKKSLAEGHHYLYCTPLTDARYRRAKAEHGLGQMGSDRYRRWEPSMDEYVGLVTGYYLVNFMLSQMPNERTNAILTEVRRQADLVGRYFKETGYFLVRPCGGFTFRGALDVNPCLEFPMAIALAKITGNPFFTYFCGSLQTFEHALDLAGYGREYREFNPSSEEMGIRASADVDQIWSASDNPKLQSKFGLKVKELLTQALAGRGGEMLLWASRTGKAALFADHLDILTQGPDGRAMVWLAYTLNWLARYTPPTLTGETGAQRVFAAWMVMPMEDDPSSAFKTLMALTSIDDPSTEVARKYRLHFDASIASVPDRGSTEITTGVNQGSWVAADAIRLLVAEDSDDQVRHEMLLEDDLKQMREALQSQSHSQPPFIDANLDPWAAVPGAPNGTVAERYDQRPSYAGFSLAVALTWLYLDLTGSDPFNELHKPAPDSVGKWPAPFVPAAVVAAARRHTIMVPVDSAIQKQPLAEGRQQYFLLKDPPDRTREGEMSNPPGPIDAVVGALIPPDSPARYSSIFSWFGRQERVLELQLPPRPRGMSPEEFVPVVTSYEALVAENVESHGPPTIDNDIVRVPVKFRTFSVSRLFRGMSAWNGYFQARVSVAWTYTPNS